MDKIVGEAARVVIDSFCHMTFVDRHNFQPIISRGAIVALSVLFIGVSVLALFPYFAAGWNFNEYGVSTLFARLGLAAAISWIAVTITVSARRMFAYTLAFMTIYVAGIAFIVYIASKLYSAFPALPYWVFYVSWIGVAFWVLFGAIRAGRRLSDSSPRIGAAISFAAVFCAFTIIPNNAVLYSPEIYDSRYDVWHVVRNLFQQTEQATEKVESTASAVDWEAILLEQPRLAQNVIDAMQNSNDGQPNIYFLGVAPYSYQAVFSRETKASQLIFDTHFKTAGRSAVLINSNHAPEGNLFASTSNLKTVAAGLKPKIDAQNDIVVMFITSHGTKDLISVDNYPMPFNQIKPKDIEDALAATGVRNRVVIISACHSGSFIDDLKDDNTAILTASSEERTSFGCSNERDWTFFTNALFNHGFRKTRDLHRAFAIATELINSWEMEQNIESSQPQIFVGKDVGLAWQKMLPHLDQFTSEPIKSAESAEIAK